MATRAIGLIGSTMFLAAWILLPPAASGEDVEPNDTTAQAIRLILPFNSASGSISSSGDIDFYSFSAKSKQLVTVWVQSDAIGSRLSAIIGLYDATGRLIAYNNDGEWNLGSNSRGEDPILYVKIPATGTYYISVSSASGFPLRIETKGGGSGPYQLYLFTQFDGTTIGDRYEPNDSRSTAAAITVPFQSYKANLLYFGDLDWYQFSARKGQKISVDVDALDKSGLADWELMVCTRIGIFDRSGRLLQSAERATDPDNGFGNEPALVFQVPVDDTYYISVTVAQDSLFSTAFTDAGFLSDPLVSSASNRLGYYEIQVREAQDLCFPQIANGDFGAVYFRTSLLLVNYSDQPATGSINLFNSDGTPMPAVLDQAGQPTSSLWFSVPAGESWVVKTDGQGPGSSGYAALRSTVPVAACAVFSQYDKSGGLMTEAGVSAATAMDAFAFPVDVTGQFNTGIALANSESSSAVNLFLKLLDAGGHPVATKTMTLEAGKQLPIYISGPGQLFPDITNFRGSLQVFADQPIPAVALRSSARTLTTLPAVTANQSYDPITLHFPQVVNGKGEVAYRSTIILTNPGYFPVTGSLHFNRSDGSPMPVKINGNQSAGHSFSLSAQGTLFLEAAASGQLEIGYASLTADHCLGAVIIYSQFDAADGNLQTEVAVAAALPSRDFWTFVEYEEGYNTGLAVANVNSSDSNLEYRLKPGSNPGGIMERGPISLQPGRQRADMLSGQNQMFPDFTGTGTLQVRSTNPVPAVALRITARTMTALPVVPVP
jgi:hypothetical protein